MTGGVYVIEGGGFSVLGAGSVTGSGVLIVNAGSDYPNTGGSYGGITLSGSGSYSLTPMTSGTYAGILFFQTSDNSQSLNVSGAASGLSGTIYAPSAALNISGSGQIGTGLIVDRMTASGAAVADALTPPAGAVGYDPAQIRTAYGIGSLPWDGTGQIIAIVDAYDDPSVDQAVDDFDTEFDLTGSGPSLYTQYGPASSFLTALNQDGQPTGLPTTDPNGPGPDDWELEEELDVEWAHAIAPGAKIVLVEASSSSLSDLMAAVATAAAQPGVSVVSMSWGFPEGQSVFAADEATYDPILSVPGVTFLASTGDAGAADPEYPAFSPSVVAVGGTTLNLSAGGSYSSETGWGDVSGSSGTSIGSGGGISLYEPEPSYQEGVQSTGYRTTPDVALLADPNTGAWVADPYNLDASSPFVVAGGTSLATPAWAGLIALVDQGRAAAAEPALNITGPSETQQALYVLPQSDYNAITSGNNGYAALAGYNLVTGLGTPVAGALVPDLIAYSGPATTYSEPTVGPLQDATLEYTASALDSTNNVFSAMAAGPASGGAGALFAASPASVGIGASTAVINPPARAPLLAPVLAGHAGPVGPIAVSAPVSAGPLPTARRTPGAAAATALSSPLASAPAEPAREAILGAIDDAGEGPFKPKTGLYARDADSLLDELVDDPALARVLDAAGTSGAAAILMRAATSEGELVVARGRAGSVPAGPLPHHGLSRRRPGTFDLLLAMGFCGTSIGHLATRRTAEGRRQSGQAIVPEARGSRALSGPRWIV